MLAEPAICRRYPGFVVPIPTLPLALINIESVPDTVVPFVAYHATYPRVLLFTVPEPTPREDVATHVGAVPAPFVLNMYPLVEAARVARAVDEEAYNMPPLLADNIPVVSEMAIDKDWVAIHDGAAVPFDLRIVPEAPAARVA